MTDHIPQRLSGASITQRVVGHGVLILALALALLLGLLYSQTNKSLQQQADALGQALITQTAKDLVTPLAADDSLALTVLLRDLVNNPYVVHAALYSIDNRTLAEAGRRPKPGKINSRYTQPLTFEQVIAGHLHLHIDVKRLQEPLYSNLQNLALMAIGLLVLAVFLLAKVARSISVPLRDLAHWLAQPVDPPLHQQRNDEVGQLARALNHHWYQQLNPEVKDPLSSVETDEPVPTTEPAPLAPEPVILPEHTAILAVQLSLSDAMPVLSDERTELLLAHYQTALTGAAAQYGAQLLTLSDGVELLLFHSDQPDYINHAVCCGELLRAFAHSLQIDIADSGAVLSLQLGISQGAAITDITEDGLREQLSVQNAIALSDSSRNLVLLCETVALHEQTLACARIRNLAKPAGASCIERLLAPYPEQLDAQLQQLMRN